MENYTIILLLLAFGLIPAVIASAFIYRWICRSRSIAEAMIIYDNLIVCPSEGDINAIEKYYELMEILDEYNIPPTEICSKGFDNLERSIYDSYYKYIEIWKEQQENLSRVLKSEKARCTNDFEKEVTRLSVAFAHSSHLLHEMELEISNFVMEHESLQGKKLPYSSDERK